MFNAEQLNKIGDIIDKEVKEIDNDGKQDFLTQKEHTEYLEHFENETIDEYMKIKGISLKERMFNSLVSSAEEYETFEDFMGDIK